MSFRFNFGGEEKLSTNDNRPVVVNCSISLRPLQKHDLVKNVEISPEHFIKHEIGDDLLFVLDENVAEKNVKSTDISESLHVSDLVAGEYEGGLKVWECTFDLLRYIKKMELKFGRKHVLDLGCGGGLLGIYASKYCDPSFTCFQDYNCEVIEEFTKPTIHENIDNLNDNNTLLLSGDWSNIEKYFCEQKIKFDIIFSSETIYNADNYEKLNSILLNCLSVDGYALISAKSFYFGVGGSVLDFIEYLKHKNNFNVASVWKNEEGLSREILKIDFKKKIP